MSATGQHKEGTKVQLENTGATCYYLVLQHCPLELKTKLKGSVYWKVSALDTNGVSLLLVIRDFMHKKGESAEHNESCGE